MKRFTATLLVAMVFLVFSPTFSFADESIESNDSNYIESCDSTLVDGDASDINIKDNDVEKGPLKAGSTVTSKLIDQYTTKEEIFVGYNSMTKDWSYASKYVIKKGSSSGCVE